MDRILDIGVYFIFQKKKSGESKNRTIVQKHGNGRSQ